MISSGRMPRLIKSSTTAPARAAILGLGGAKPRPGRSEFGRLMPERLDGRGHGVGRVHAAARAGRREWRMPRSRAQLPVVDRPVACAPTASNTETMSSGRGTHPRLDDVLAEPLRDHLAGDAAGQNRAAINENRGPVQPRNGHEAARHVFVAAADGHQAVEALAADDRLDGIGDHLARHQRIFHPFGAHRDAVGDGDGIENNRLAAGVVRAARRLRAPVGRCACCRA